MRALSPSQVTVPMVPTLKPRMTTGSSGCNDPSSSKSTMATWLTLCCAVYMLYAMYAKRAMSASIEM